jgi:hypothetical protein
MAIGLAIVGGLQGCSSSDPLGSGTESLTVRYVPNPAGAGRYNRADLTLQRIHIRPADPELVPIYGSTPLALKFGTFRVDMTLESAAVYSEIALVPGDYIVTIFELTRPQLVDSDAITAPASCVDAIAALPSGPATGAVPNLFTYPNPPSLAFTVRPGQTQLNLTMNVPGVIAAYEAAFTCNPDCGGGAPCLTGFDAAAFTTAYLANISLQ